MTKSSKHVDQIRRFINAIVLVCGVILLFSFFYWAAVSRGFDHGYRIAVAKFEKADKGHGSEPVVGHIATGTYEGLAREYFLLGLIALGVLAVSGIKRFWATGIFPVILSIANVLLLIFVWVRLKWLLGLKDPAMNESLGSPYNALVRESAFYDWASIFTVTLLVLAELFLLIKSLRSASTK